MRPHCFRSCVPHVHRGRKTKNAAEKQIKSVCWSASAWRGVWVTRGDLRKIVRKDNTEITNIFVYKMVVLKEIALNEPWHKHHCNYASWLVKFELKRRAQLWYHQWLLALFTCCISTLGTANGYYCLYCIMVFYPGKKSVRTPFTFLEDPCMTLRNLSLQWSGIIRIPDCFHYKQDSLFSQMGSSTIVCPYV